MKTFYIMMLGGISSQGRCMRGEVHMVWYYSEPLELYMAAGETGSCISYPSLGPVLRAPKGSVAGRGA